MDNVRPATETAPAPAARHMASQSASRPADKHTARHPRLLAKLEYFSPGAGITRLVAALTDYCNLSCRFCYMDSGPRLRTWLEWELLRQLLDDMDGIPITFLTGGQPTYYSKSGLLLGRHSLEKIRAFQEVTSYAAGRCGELQVCTNGREMPPAEVRENRQKLMQRTGEPCSEVALRKLHEWGERPKLDTAMTRQVLEGYPPNLSLEMSATRFHKQQDPDIMLRILMAMQASEGLSMRVRPRVAQEYGDFGDGADAMYILGTTAGSHDAWAQGRFAGCMSAEHVYVPVDVRTAIEKRHDRICVAPDSGVYLIETAMTYGIRRGPEHQEALLGNLCGQRIEAIIDYARERFFDPDNWMHWRNRALYCRSMGDEEGERHAYGAITRLPERGIHVPLHAIDGAKSDLMAYGCRCDGSPSAIGIDSELL